MTETPDELPEIQLEEVLDEKAGSKLEAEIDIDFGDEAAPPPAAAPKPAIIPTPPAALPTPGESFSLDLDVDLATTPSANEKAVPTQSLTPGAVPTPAVVSKPVAGIEPVPVAVAPPEPLPMAPKPTTTTAKPTPSSLDLDALLSDLGLSDTKATKEIALEPAAPPAAQEAIPEPPAEFRPLGEFLSSDEEELAPPESEPAAPVSAPSAAPTKGTFEPDADAMLDAAFSETAGPSTGVVEAPQAQTAPPLPPLEGEPPQHSALAPSDLPTTADAIETLKRLAGAGWDPEQARAALAAALNGESYDPRALPEPRVMVLGIARALVASGFAAHDLVEAIMAVLAEQ